MSYQRFKTFIIGDGGVGKTTLVNRYVSGRYSENFKMTIGVEFYTKILEIDGKKAQLQIWDFAGEQQFKSLLPNYVIGASGGIFMYDISRFSSLKNLESWLVVLKKNQEFRDDYFPILLVGGKLDLEEAGRRVIQIEYAKKYGKENNLFDFIECSSKTGENVEKAFEIITRKMMQLTGQIE